MQKQQNLDFFSDFKYKFFINSITIEDIKFKVELILPQNLDEELEHNYPLVVQL